MVQCRKAKIVDGEEPMMRWPSTLWLGVRILLPYPVRLILCLFVVLMVFYVVGFNDLHDQDMWQGLAIEFARIIFVVIVIDSLIAYARRRDTMPIRYVAVLSAYAVFNRAVKLWKSMVQAGYIPARDNALLEDPTVGLFDHRLVLIASRLDLNSPRYQGSHQTWRDYLVWQGDETIKSMIESLQAYGAHMSPNLLYALNDFRYQGFWSFCQHSSAIQAMRLRAGVPNSGQLDFGDPNNPYKFLESMRLLGEVLASEIPQFKGMEDLPSTIDADCRWGIEEIMTPSC